MPPRTSRDLIDAALPLVVLLVLFAVAFTTLQPFLPAIVWGIILSISLRPVHDRLTARFGGRRGPSTLIVGVAMVLVMVLPMFGLSRALIAFIPEAIRWMSDMGGPSLTPDGVALPDPGAEGGVAALWETLVADFRFIQSHFSDELRPMAFWLIGEGRLIGLFVIEFALGVLLATILLHRAGPLGAAFLHMADRVGGGLATDLTDHAVLAVRSTVFGLLGSAAAQTAVAAIAYFIVGAPHWPVLALLTFLLAMVQIGPILIWLPIAIWLWVDGQTGMAIFLAVWGLVVVGLTDNLVKAHLVSRGSDLPAILAFLGATGGLITWGIVGLFLGPVIVAVCYQLTLRWLHLEPAGAEAEPAAPRSDPD